MKMPWLEKRAGKQATSLIKIKIMNMIMRERERERGGGGGGGEQQRFITISFASFSNLEHNFEAQFVCLIASSEISRIEF